MHKEFVKDIIKCIFCFLYFTSFTNLISLFFFSLFGIMISLFLDLWFLSPSFFNTSLLRIYPFEHWHTCSNEGLNSLQENYIIVLLLFWFENYIILSSINIWCLCFKFWMKFYRLVLLFLFYISTFIFCLRELIS